MLFYLLGFVLGLFVFLQIPALGGEEPPRFLYLGRVVADLGGSLHRKTKLPASRGSDSKTSQSKAAAGGVDEPASQATASSLQSEFNGILVGPPSGPGTRRVALTNGRTFSFAEPLRAYVPFLGSGFLKYQKVGGLLEYVAPSGELLWKKDYAAYPYSDPTGKLLLFVTGDANDAILGDENGTALAKSAGDFMSHHCFASRARRVGLSFSGTAFRVLDEKGAVLLDWAPTEGRFFLKSCALSSDGSRAALHYDSANADWIAIFEMRVGKTPRRLARFKLDARYPHLLPLALGNGGLLLGAPDRVLFFDEDGDLVWSKKTKQDGLYRPVYADRSLFVYGVDDDALVLDGRGRLLARIGLPLGVMAWRVAPARSDQLFAIQSGTDVLFFRFEPAAR